MILDQQSLFSDAQAITTTANSTNVVDQGPNVGLTGMVANPVSVFAQIGTGFAGGASLQISVVSADDAALSVNPITHFGSPVIPLASLTARTLILGTRVPPQKMRRYLGLLYNVNGVMTAGTITAGIVEDLNSVLRSTDFAKQYTA